MNDPFKDARREHGVLACPFSGETVPMILRHADVRAAAKDWRTYSSDAPFRVPIPSEEAVRTVRQLPIETDPPEHQRYRKLVEPLFKRAKLPETIAKVSSLVERLLDEALNEDAVEVVRDFALPLQSHALTYLLNVAEKEAETWIGWGIHVFHDGDDEGARGAALDDYLAAQLDHAESSPGDDFFTLLTQLQYEGRPLTREEQLGFANLTFAGGRDTVIHSISSIVHYFAAHPEGLAYLREDPKRVVYASEEFFRAISPLTHIGRVCPVEHQVHGVPVKPQGRVSLGWASANHDETVFDAPDQIQLDRKPNPHLAFGAGHHLCLGAAHARLLVRTLLEKLCTKVSQIHLKETEARAEIEEAYTRTMGFERLLVSFEAKREADAS